MKINWIIFLIPVLVYAPNLIYVILKPKNVPIIPDSDKANLSKLFTFLERTGQSLVFFVPIVLSCYYDIEASFSNYVYSYSAILCLIVYYAGWIRYIIKGRDYSLLFSNMLGVPIPMAIFPILYLFFCGLILKSTLMLAGVLILALGHIPESLKNRKLTR